jgi:hypothetical protein
VLAQVAISGFVVITDKHERMKAINKYYLDNQKDALKEFPGGSEKGS